MKKIEGFPNYSITENGRVWSHTSNRFLKPASSKRGYLFVHIRGDSLKNVYVHREVAKSYLPLVEGKTHVNHKDSNKTNNHAGNLEWCTNAENLLHSYQNGRKPNRGNGKLSPEQVKLIRNRYFAGISAYRIAKDMKLKWDTVSNIVKGRSWTNV